MIFFSGSCCSCDFIQVIVDDDNGDWLISSIERPVKLRWKEKGIRGNYESWEKNIELQSFVE